MTIKMTKRLPLCLDQETLAKLRKLAAEHDRSMASMMRTLIREKAQHEQQTDQQEMKVS